MLVILEGVDGAGKSTLAERLVEYARASGVITLHKGPMTGNAIEEYEHPLEDYWPGEGQHVICDRWHLGELVYGPMLRGRTNVSLPERRHIEKFLLRRGATLVHVAAPSSEIRRRFNERGDDLIKAEQLPTIIEGYHRELNASEIPSWFYDTATRDEIISIITTAATTEIAAVPLDPFKTYVGGPTPRLLLLGETRNLAKGDSMRSAFVPLPATSGEYLLRHLPSDINVNTGIANALEEDIGLLYERLGEPMVVALGREAARQCEQAELPYGEVPHPQFVRRFRNARGTEYGHAIREAALFRRDMTGVFADTGT